MRVAIGIIILLACLMLTASVGSIMMNSITIPSSGQVQIGSNLPMGMKLIQSSFENEPVSAPRECGQGLYVPKDWADADVGDGVSETKLWYIDASDSRAPSGGFPDGSHGIYGIADADVNGDWSVEDFLMARHEQVSEVYVQWWQRFKTFPAQGSDWLPIFWVTGQKLRSSDGAVQQYTVPYVQVIMTTQGLSLSLTEEVSSWNISGSVPANAIQSDSWNKFEFSLVMSEKGSCIFKVNDVTYVNFNNIDTSIESINQKLSDYNYTNITGFEVGMQFPSSNSQSSYEWWLDNVLEIGANAPDIFDTSFESLTLGTRTDNEGGTDGHGIVQNAIVHSGTQAWKLWGLKQTLWTTSTSLQCLGGSYNGQTKTLGEVSAAGLLASDSASGTYQFADGGNGYPKLLMMNSDGSLPSGYAGPEVPNDGKYHWTVSNGYPRARIGIGGNIPAYDDIYLRVYFYLERLDGYVQILRLYAPSGTANGYMCMVTVTKGEIIAEGVGGEFHYSTSVTLNQWHYLEMRFKRGTSDGVVQVWFDDPETPVIDKQNLNTSGAFGATEYTPLTGLVLDGTYPDCELTFYVDDFAASRNRAYFFSV